MSGRKKGSKIAYRTTLITSDLYEQLRQFVKNSGGRYVSISEAARQAIWEFLQNREETIR